MSCPGSSPPLPEPLVEHSLGIQGTTHVTVTRTAAQQVMAQAPVARLGEKKLLGARNRPLLPRPPIRESNDGFQPLPALVENWLPSLASQT